MLRMISGILLLLFLVNAASYSQAQERERVIATFKSGMRTTLTPANGPPQPTDFIAVEVLELKLAGSSIKLDQPFRAADNWLQNLRAKVRNVSQKSISHVRMVFMLPEARYQEVGREQTMGFELEYAAAKSPEGRVERKVLLPGEEVELRYMDSEVSLSQQIASRTGVTTINQLKYGGDVNAIFVDGSIWIGANLPMSTGKPKN